MTKPELAPVDMACCSLDVFDDTEKYFRRMGEPYVNKTSDWIIYAGIMNAMRVKPVPIIWSIGSIRATEALADMGLFKPPLWCELVLTGGTRAVLLDAHPGNVAGLGAYLDFFPKEPGWHWAVMVHATDMSTVAKAAMERGGHIAIGLGDYGYPNLCGNAEPTNAQLVEHIVRLAREVGRPVATPARARELLGLGT